MAPSATLPKGSDLGLDFDFEVSTEAAPPKKDDGSALDRLVAYAIEHPGQWVIYPKANAKGEREPAVNGQTFYGLRKRHWEKDESLEFELVDRVKTGKNGSSIKGVLWVRKPVEAGKA